MLFFLFNGIEKKTKHASELWRETQNFVEMFWCPVWKHEKNEKPL